MKQETCHLTALGKPTLLRLHLIMAQPQLQLTVIRTPATALHSRLSMAALELQVTYLVTRQPRLQATPLELLQATMAVLVMEPHPRQATVKQLHLLTLRLQRLVMPPLRQRQVMAILHHPVMELAMLLATVPLDPRTLPLWLLLTDSLVPLTVQLQLPHTALLAQLTLPLQLTNTVLLVLLPVPLRPPHMALLAQLTLPLQLMDTAPLVLHTAQLRLLDMAPLCQLMLLIQLMLTAPLVPLTAPLRHPDMAPLALLTILLPLPAMAHMALPTLPLQLLCIAPLALFTHQIQHIVTVQLLPATLKHRLVAMDTVGPLLVMALDMARLLAMDLTLLRITLLREATETTQLKTPPNLQCMGVVHRTATERRVATHKVGPGTRLPVRLMVPPIPLTQRTLRRTACLTTSPYIPAKEITPP